MDIDNISPAMNYFHWAGKTEKGIFETLMLQNQKGNYLPIVCVKEFDLGRDYYLSQKSTFRKLAKLIHSL